MGEGGGAAAAGQDEILERRQFGVEVGDRGFEPANVCVPDQLRARDADFAAQIEQVVLHAEQDGTDAVRAILGQQEAEAGVEFVDLADGFDAQAVLVYARSVAESGGATVARAGDDF